MRLAYIYRCFDGQARLRKTMSVWCLPLLFSQGIEARATSHLEIRSVDPLYYHHRLRGKKNQTKYLLLTDIHIVLLKASPTPFSTWQVYSPASDKATESNIKDPLDRLRTPPPATSNTGRHVSDTTAIKKT